MKARKLAVRGNVALVAAVLLGVFLAVFLIGSRGEWSPWAARFAVGVAFAAVLSLACRLLAHLAARRGDSPPVSHPSPIVSQTPSEVGK